MYVYKSVQSTLYIQQNPIGRTKLVFFLVPLLPHFTCCQVMKYTYVHPWKRLSPFCYAQLTVCVFQGQGPRPARMWFLHRWDQQMHQRHWAGLPCSCQSESGHQGWHLSRGEGHSTGARQRNAAFPFECLELSAPCNLLPVRSILTGTFLGKILYQPKCVTSGKTPESPGKSRGESRFFSQHPHFTLTACADLTDG